ncbi:MAG TPA: Uma2 family endonuclease [Pirellulales bacterium]|nr:Uma2 family endonuclease [Pirellulales bacterium]
MSIIPPISPPATTAAPEIVYPSSDGRPLAETPLHRDVLVTMIEVLDKHYTADPMVYVSGNMLVYYEKGNKRKHVSPDVFVVKGIPKDKRRDYFLVWEERNPDLVIEITSKSTQDEDQTDKLALYRDVLQVSEVILFDPRGEYLVPRLKGYRLRDGRYETITAVTGGKLPSDVLGLQFEADGHDLRLYDPITRRRLTTQKEDKAAAETFAEAQRKVAEAQRQRAEAERKRADEQESRAEVQRKLAAEQQLEIERLRREIELLKGTPRAQ